MVDEMFFVEKNEDCRLNPFELSGEELNRIYDSLFNKYMDEVVSGFDYNLDGANFLVSLINDTADEIFEKTGERKRRVLGRFGDYENLKKDNFYKKYDSGDILGTLLSALGESLPEGEIKGILEDKVKDSYIEESVESDYNPEKLFGYFFDKLCGEGDYGKLDGKLDYDLGDEEDED